MSQPVTPELIRQVGRQAALAAGALLRQNYEKPHDITMKGAIDPVTESDFASQQLIVNLIHQTFPDHGILAEEVMEDENEVGEGAKGRGPLAPPPHPLPQSLEGEYESWQAVSSAPSSTSPSQGWEGGAGEGRELTLPGPLPGSFSPHISLDY